jgi:trimethylamine--corrinoid protein Co-methyltransferase
MIMSSETPPLQPVVPAYHVHVLDENQLRQLQDATLSVLEEVGVHVPSERALHIYAGHEAQVDFETQIVRLPREIVRKYMAYAPRSYTMGARLSTHDLTLDGSRLYCATDGCGVETIDFTTRQRRASCKQDVADTARLCDALSSIGFYWPMVSAQEFQENAPLHEVEAAFNNTVKHVQSETVMGERLAKSAVEMARVVAGDTDTLHNRPPLSLLVCAIAPLAQDREGLESGLMFAEAGLPVGFMSMANTGSTAPATLAGTLVTGDAEIISALVLMQMAAPGTPVFHSLMPGIMQPRRVTIWVLPGRAHCSMPRGWSWRTPGVCPAWRVCLARMP